MALSGTLTKDGRLTPGAARVFWIAGLLLLLGGIWIGAPVWWLMATGARAQAVVLRVADPTDAAAPNRSYVATLEFDAGGGNPARVERLLQRARYGSDLAEGDAVGVAFPKGQPARAQVLSSRTPWAGGFTAIFVGALLIGVTFAGRRRTPAP